MTGRVPMSANFNAVKGFSGALAVMAGLVPAIHVKPRLDARTARKAAAATAVFYFPPALRLDDVDGRDKPGHDDGPRSEAR